MLFFILTSQIRNKSIKTLIYKTAIVSSRRLTAHLFRTETVPEGKKAAISTLNGEFVGARGGGEVSERGASITKHLIKHVKHPTKQMH